MTEKGILPCCQTSVTAHILPVQQELKYSTIQTLCSISPPTCTMGKDAASTYLQYMKLSQVSKHCLQARWNILQARWTAYKPGG